MSTTQTSFIPTKRSHGATMDLVRMQLSMNKTAQQISESLNLPLEDVQTRITYIRAREKKKKAK